MTHSALCPGPVALSQFRLAVAVSCLGNVARGAGSFTIVEHRSVIVMERQSQPSRGAIAAAGRFHWRRHG